MSLRSKEPNTSNLKYSMRHAFFSAWMAVKPNSSVSDPNLIRAWNQYDPSENASYRIIREHMGHFRDYR